MQVYLQCHLSNKQGYQQCKAKAIDLDRLSDFGTEVGTASDNMEECDESDGAEEGGEEEDNDDDDKDNEEEEEEEEEDGEEDDGANDDDNNEE